MEAGLSEKEQAEYRAMRDALAGQQLEVERLRAENARMQKRVAVLEDAVRGESEEREKLIATIARSQSMHEKPEHAWPKFPENTMVRILSTNVPTGMIDVAINDGDTVESVAKRLSDVATSALRLRKARLER